MPVPQTETPLLLDAAGAFSHLKIVSYRNRLLYSKYNPCRTITSLIQNTAFLPGTVVLVCAPCLWYGLDELRAALPASCAIIAVQDDDALLALAAEQLALRENDGTVRLFGTGKLDELDTYLRNLAATGQYRRVLRLDFSAGVQLNPAIYSAIASAAQEIVASFWMNHVTLVRMGRLFAKNIFRNLARLGEDAQLPDMAHSVSRPIVVCGAGESLDATFAAPLSGSAAFVIAVDAAFPALVARGVPCDAVVSLESQSVIQKAYIGTAGKGNGGSPPLLFADIASLPAVPRAFAGQTVWFASKYTDAAYLDELARRGIIGAFTPPLGSVGLAAVQVALALRADESVPVFVTGLDFSYSLGITHAKGTPQHRSRLNASCRLLPMANYDAAFATGTFAIEDKRRFPMVTSKILRSYADSFAETFRNTPMLFDMGESGLPLGIPHCTRGDCARTLRAWQTGAPDGVRARLRASQGGTAKAQKIKDLIADFYRNERNALLTLRDLLVHGEGSGCRDASLPLDEQVMALLRGREYLYLHFPDGYAPSPALSFLKRVRAEIDFFLKQIEGVLSGL